MAMTLDAGEVASPSALRAFSRGSFGAASPAAQYERLESNIGEGTYGKVSRAKDVRTGKVVAIKKAKVSAVDQQVGGIGFTALREIKLMQAIKHPHVMGCLDVYAENGVLHLVMDFMNTDMRRVIDDRSLACSEADAKCMARQLMCGLAALHRRWFVHRDVTPGNVFMNSVTGVAMLGDFGFARTIGHRDRPLTPLCTTLWYRAPELLYGAKFYGQAVDIWSAGCIVAELFLRKPLFQGHGEIGMMTKIFEKRGTPTEDVWTDVSALPSYLEFSKNEKVPMSNVLGNASSFAQSLIDGLLSLDPKQRPTADGALQHEFFTHAQPAETPFLQLPFVQQDDVANS